MKKYRVTECEVDTKELKSANNFSYNCYEFFKYTAYYKVVAICNDEHFVKSTEFKTLEEAEEFFEQCPVTFDVKRREEYNQLISTYSLFEINEDDDEMFIDSIMDKLVEDDNDEE